MPLRQSMQRLAGDELLRYLSFECGAVGTVLGHGFHPLKARRRWSIPNPSPVHPEGRTPIWGPVSMIIDNHRPEMPHPTPNGLVGNRHSALRQQILDVTQAEREP